MSAPSGQELRLLDFIRTRLGLHFTPEKMPDVRRAISGSAMELNFTDADAFLNNLFEDSTDAQTLRVLAGHLTIGETYFFREPVLLDFFSRQVKKLIAERRAAERSLRIWSAGCSSGEEPYTIAMILHELIPDINEWNISLTGTDLNTDSLQKARTGLYGEWSFRGMPEAYRTKYFTALPDGRYAIAEKIQSFVEFSRLNLFEGDYPSPITRTNFLDYIFCRNVLMYFDDAGREHILKRFHDALRVNGLLFLGLTELAHQSHIRFIRRKEGDAFYFEKDPYAKNESPPARAEVRSGASNTPPSKPPIVKAPAGPPQNVSDKRPDELQTLYEKKNYGEIIARFLTPALSTDTKFLSAATEYEWEMLIKSLANLGMHEKALELSETGLSFLKTSPLLYFTQAAICMEKGNLQDAIAALKKCLYLDNLFLAAYYLLFSIYRQTGNKPEAKRNADIMKKLAGSLSKDAPVRGMEDTCVGDILFLIDAGGY